MSRDCKYSHYSNEMKTSGGFFKLDTPSMKEKTSFCSTEFFVYVGKLNITVQLMSVQLFEVSVYFGRHPICIPKKKFFPLN